MEPTHRTFGNRASSSPSPRLHRSRSVAPAVSYDFRGSSSGSTTSKTSIKPYQLKKVQEDESKRISSNQDPMKRLPAFHSFRKTSQEEKQESLIIAKPVRKARSAATSPSAWALSPGRPTAIMHLMAQAKPSPSAWALQSAPMQSGTSHDKYVKKKKPSAMDGVLRLFRTRKVPAAEVEACHQLRMLHNRYLQWRFLNMRAARAMALRESRAQKKLSGVWMRVCELRNYLTEKRIQVQRLKREIRLHSILSSQIVLLEEWDKIEKRNVEAVAATVRLMQATSIMVPLVAGAKADVISVHRAFCTAMDVVKRIEATVSKFFFQVKKVSCLLCELLDTKWQEREGLVELMRILGKMVFFLEQERILRVYIIQARGRELST